mmetsp:Transcript_158361/g.507924  ORF Transcript_158361/g.507924 Transcript_158361/m.507924 type:complete len:116 (-) Transcript_158361:27-374(-)
MKRNGIEQNCLTFAHWRHWFAGTLLDLDAGRMSNLSTVWKHRDEFWKMMTSSDYDYLHSSSTGPCEEVTSRNWGADGSPRHLPKALASAICQLAVSSPIEGRHAARLKVRASSPV